MKGGSSKVSPLLAFIAVIDTCSYENKIQNGFTKVYSLFREKSLKDFIGEAFIMLVLAVAYRNSLFARLLANNMTCAKSISISTALIIPTNHSFKTRFVAFFTTRRRA